MCQDKFGNIWFGTYGGGVSKFNGLTFENYTTEHGLANNQVNKIIRDKSENLWFCTDGGISFIPAAILSHADTSSQIFTNYTEKDGLAGNNVWTGLEDNDGVMWFGTNEGLSKLVGKEVTETESLFINTKLGLSHNVVRSLLQDKHGIYWIGTENGLTRYDASKSAGESYSYYSAKHGLENDFIWSILEDIEGNIWFGTGEGIARLGATEQEPVTAIKFKFYDEIDGTALNIVYSIIQDEEKNIWFACWGGVGAVKYTVALDKFSRLTVADGLCDNNLMSLLEDVEGNIWFGTYGMGACKINNRCFEIYSKEVGLADNFVWCVTEDQSANIWIAGNLGGVTRIVKEKNKSGSREKAILQGYSTDDGLIGDRVYSIITDLSGDLWFCTEEGLSKLEMPVPAFAPDGVSPPKLNFINYNNQNGLSQNRVRSMFQDSHGNYWIGYIGGVVVILDFNDAGRIISETAIEHEILKNFDTYKVHEDRHGDLWFATGGGVVKALIRDSKGGISKFASITTRQGLIHNDVRAIVEDKNGGLWFGTGGGISKYNPDRTGRKFENYSAKEGLSSSRVNLLLFDKDQNLWVGTNVGIDKLDMKQYFGTAEKFDATENEFKTRGVVLFKHYGFSEGFTGNETNTNAVCKDVKGNLWFGTIRGAIKYIPEQDKINTRAPVMQLLGLKLFTEGIPLITNTNFNYDQNHLTFTYIGISHTIPDKVKYKHRLLGYHDDWSNPSSENLTVFAGLAPGHYTFELNACNADGVWNEEPIAFNFLITPPFWKSIWFYLIVLFSVIALVYSLIRFRVRSLKKTADILQEQIQLKTSALQASESQYRTLFEQVGDSIFVFDKNDQSILDCNATALKIYGYTKEELRTMTLYDHHPVDKGEQVKKELAADETDKLKIFTHLTKDGMEVHVEMQSDEIIYQGVPALLYTGRDGTEQRKSEQEINRINMQLTGSIRYSKRILDAILQNKSDLTAMLEESFIFFKPKDIVSGDFYWFSRLNGKIVVAAVDCTGHGVAGAFMSLVGNELLREIINNKGIYDPSVILSEMHKGIINTLKSAEDTPEYAGAMDMAICTIDTEKGYLEFAGAGRPLILISNGKEEIINGNKFPIGLTLTKTGKASEFYTKKSTDANGAMKMERRKLKKGDTFYLFTDGYCDQFGGDKGDKFMRARFKDLLLSIQDKKMSEQEKILEERIEEWRGENPQVDDMLVIGIKV